MFFEGIGAELAGDHFGYHLELGGSFGGLAGLADDVEDCFFKPGLDPLQKAHKLGGVDIIEDEEPRGFAGGVVEVIHIWVEGGLEGDIAQG
ncbi:MAG: hypothetical protein A2Y07_09705 [Planctomycetes bacterium GWF2_50_10]|nr:MAG: hypothetical protein A2Y07_09705 [Planctomycetes bacterium GWF2_50_10]